MPHRYFLPILNQKAACAIILLCGVALLHAQDTVQQSSATVNLNQIYQDGMNAFHVGDYQKAAANLESLISQAAQEAQLEPAYFTLGAAYFNLQQYAKSIEVFKKYLEKFPKSTRSADAIYSMGRASLMLKDYAGAQGYFKQLESNPKTREEACYQEGMAWKMAGQTDEAIAAFEKVTGPEINGVRSANSAILLAELYVKKHDAPKAIAMLQKLQGKLALVNNVVRLNSLAVELGDALLEDQKPELALTCFRLVRSREEVVKFQGDRIVSMQKTIDRNIETMRAGGDPSVTMALLNENNQVRDAIVEEKKLLDEFQKLPDIQAPLLLRMGRCYYNMGKKWEAIVVYDTLLRKYPETSEREQALYGLIISSADVGRVKQTHEYCDEYLRLFPRSQCADSVGYLQGATALQANDPKGAETYFGRMLREQPNNTYREEMQFLLGNALFAQGKYEEAARVYEKTLRDYPNGTHFEEATYRISLCSVFLGKYEDATRQITSYLGRYPQGAFVADAQYRLAVCKYAASLDDEVIADCNAWLKKFSGHTMSGEVLALLADALDASGKTDEAIETYIRAYKLAATDEVMNYALFAAQKLLLKKGQWERIGSMFEEFVKEKPDNPTVVTAMYWIGKAMAHQGKTEEAKQFFAKTIKQYIDDLNRDAVEMLLTQIAQLCVRKKSAVAVGAAPPAIAAASASPAEDAGMELDQLLGSGGNETPTARARMLFAKSELARLRKQIPEQEKDLQAIADGFRPEDLSPSLLAQTGDYLLGKGQYDKATVLYQRLMDDYPKSPMVDYAYNGLGEIAWQRKQYEVALRYFVDAVDVAGATTKLKDVTVGKAKCLLALNRLEDARKAFEQVASVREWRGDATAYSVYSLGEIAQKQNKLAEAIADYQRVYVAYQRFLPWVAKAYVQSAECFEKLGKMQEALNTYREMLRNEKLANFPETEMARKRLQEAGQG